ncbi:MAG: class I SAM-dependent methyltransferase [Candidatus Omnitrophota bacterium]
MKRLRRVKKNLNFFLKRGATRGYGALEYVLALQRAKLANKFITDGHRTGKILDIGCGSYPIFLLTSKFVEKFGIEKIIHSNHNVRKRVKLINHDIEKGDNLPFADNSISTITMLAVFEHISLYSVPNILSEIYRILKPKGICIITIPATWSEVILKIMSNIRLISKIELDEHKSTLSTAKILSLLQKAKFINIKSGYFEFFMNRWFVVKK